MRIIVDYDARYSFTRRDFPYIAITDLERDCFLSKVPGGIVRGHPQSVCSIGEFRKSERSTGINRVKVSLAIQREFHTVEIRLIRGIPGDRCGFIFVDFYRKILDLRSNHIHDLKDAYFAHYALVQSLVDRGYSEFVFTRRKPLNRERIGLAIVTLAVEVDDVLIHADIVIRNLPCEESARIVGRLIRIKSGDLFGRRDILEREGLLHGRALIARRVHRGQSHIKLARDILKVVFGFRRIYDFCLIPASHNIMVDSDIISCGIPGEHHGILAGLSYSQISGLRCGDILDFSFERFTPD